MMSDVFRGFRSFQTSTRGLRRNNSGGGTSYRKGILIQQKFLPPLQAHAVADDAAEPDANAPCSSARNCGHTGSWLFNGFEEFTFRCHSHCFSLFRVHMVPENSEMIPLRVVKGVRSSTSESAERCAFPWSILAFSMLPSKLCCQFQVGFTVS